MLFGCSVRKSPLTVQRGTAAGGPGAGRRSLRRSSARGRDGVGATVQGGSRCGAGGVVWFHRCLMRRFECVARRIPMAACHWRPTLPRHLITDSEGGLSDVRSSVSPKRHIFRIIGCRAAAKGPARRPKVRDDARHAAVHGGRAGLDEREWTPMPRKWTINGRFLSQPLTGVQRYAREVVSAIDALAADGDPLARDVEIGLVVPAGVEDDLALRTIRTRRAGPLRGHAWEQLVLPVHAEGELLSLATTPRFPPHGRSCASTTRIPATARRAIRPPSGSCPGRCRRCLRCGGRR